MSENVYIRLRGGRAKQFLRIKDQLERRAGHSLEHVDVFTLLFIIRRTELDGQMYDDPSEPTRDDQERKTTVHTR